ncbi:MAG: BadF/BadG/BcrA/BcrD ATPase family protein [Acidimicrobiales bacterium]|jgi:N-acetylglucosamine kinase-like BadF-type ATPase
MAGNMVTGPATSPTLVLAVDGGASKTDAWVVGTDGSILGTARGAGSNHQLSGLDGAMGALGSTIDAALGDAGLGTGERPAVGIGAYCMAGLDLPVDEERLVEAIGSRRWSAQDLVRNDTMAVLRAGVRSGWGIGVVCGSGLNCVGLGPTGSVARFPSLGELSGDFAAGGSWLGVRTLGLALRSRDGRGGPTSLAELVPSHFDLPDAESVLEAVYSGTVGFGRLFELARVCMDAATAGDTTAQGAVRFLAGEVVAMVTAAASRLGVSDGEVEVVLGGGLFASEYHTFTEWIETGVRESVPGAHLRRIDAAPVLGAALLGLDAAGAPPDAGRRLRTLAPAPDPGDEG